MRSILFVCTANICRSPTAKAVLRKILHKEGMQHVEVDSVGTHDYHAGKPPFPTAVKLAKLHGYDIAKHVARRIQSDDFDRFDLILAMDQANVSHLKTIAPTRSKHKIELLLEYGNRFHGQEIDDPYGGTERDFELALKMIEDGCQGLAELVKKMPRGK